MILFVTILNAVGMAMAADMYFTDLFAYMSVDGDIGTVGVNQCGVHLMGDLVYVEIEVEVGSKLQVGDKIGYYEQGTWDGAASLYAPASGTVTAINKKVFDAPELVNKSPYEDGWFVKIELDNKDELNMLLSKEQYDTTKPEACKV